MCVEYQWTLKEILFILEGQYSFRQAVVCVCEDREGSVSQSVQKLSRIYALSLLLLSSVHHILHSPFIMWYCYHWLYQRAFLGVSILLQLEQSLNAPHRDYARFCPCYLLSDTSLRMETWKFLIFLFYFLYLGLRYRFFSFLPLLPMPVKLFLNSIVDFGQERLPHHSPEGAELCLYSYRVQVLWVSCLLEVFNSSLFTEAMNFLSEFWKVFDALSLREGSEEVSCFHSYFQWPLIASCRHMPLMELLVPILSTWWKPFKRTWKWIQNSLVPGMSKYSKSKH